MNEGIPVISGSVAEIATYTFIAVAAIRAATVNDPLKGRQVLFLAFGIAFVISTAFGIRQLYETTWNVIISDIIKSTFMAGATAIGSAELQKAGTKKVETEIANVTLTTTQEVTPVETPYDHGA